MIAVASDMESVFVYECSSNRSLNCQQIWSAQLPFVPIAIARANFDGLPGGIVLLGPEGQIHVGFFGTDPQIYKVQELGDTKGRCIDIDTVDVQKELLEIDEAIRNGIDFTGKEGKFAKQKNHLRKN